MFSEVQHAQYHQQWRPQEVQQTALHEEPVNVCLPLLKNRAKDVQGQHAQSSRPNVPPVDPEQHRPKKDGAPI